MPKRHVAPVIQQVMTEQNQGHETRREIYNKLEQWLGRPIVSFFTSFNFPVMIEDTDADMLEGILQKMDLSNGLALVISSPGGYGLAAERIINVCRSYSKTKDYWAIVPGKAKSAATMICFGASKVIMGPTSELGPIDPQVSVETEKGVIKRFSVYNIIESYNNLFSKAIKEKGNLEPYLQQLSNYDEREITEFRDALSLAEDIAIKTLRGGMMKDMSEDDIKEKIKIFLTPKQTKTHGRPIYAKEAKEDCNLKVELMDVMDEYWKFIYELYIRTDNYVTTKALKCFESKDHSFGVKHT